jgi:predicted nucleic acid-binding protein
VTACVLDPSVAAKWFLPRRWETLAAEAEQVQRSYARGQLRILVPDLFWPEFGNTMWKAARQGRITRASAEDAIAAMEATDIASFRAQPLLKDAFGIASAFERTVYDSIYVALAVVAGVPLLTADERMANALAARFPIRWLGAL